MRTIEVHASRSYNIYIGSGILDNINDLVAGVMGGARKVLIISDDNVYPLYAGKVIEALKEFEVDSFIFAHGEHSKTLDTYNAIINKASVLGLNRNDIIIALGGGVVGDIAGFVAGTYMRGIGYIQIPTTLLAGIDSSVGGKTGVNLNAGKNLVGVFHQPLAVIFDTLTLDTLHDCVYRDGIGEGVKYAVLCGGRIYDIMAEGLNKSNLEEYVALAVGYKRDIVEEDEREGSIRRLLNLGHTVGHAIEKLSDFGISHGVAVAEGIRYIADISLNEGLLSVGEYKRVVALLKLYDLDTKHNYDIKNMVDAISMDKKTERAEIKLIMIKAIGDCIIRGVKIESLEGMLSACTNS